MYIPYQRSRGGTIINEIRTMIRSMECNLATERQVPGIHSDQRDQIMVTWYMWKKQEQQASKQHTEKVNIMLIMLNPSNPKNYNSTK